jgi:ATP-dependent 26S proteasome regulatory subunit
MQEKQTIISKEEQKSLRQHLLTIGDGNIGRDLFHFIKSRYRILYIRSPEEKRIIETFKIISKSEGYDLFQWDTSRGMLNSFTMESVTSDGNEVNTSEEAVLDYIIQQAKSDNEKMNKQKANKQQIKSSGGHIYLLLDYHYFLEGQPVIERKFKEFASFSSISHIIIVSPVFICPPSLNKEFTLIDFPPPSQVEIAAKFDEICSEIPANFPDAKLAAKHHREELLKATAGLTLPEAENAYAKSLIKKKTFDVPTILDEKKQIIRKGGILECRDSKFNFDQVGGLESLKEWLATRRLAFKEDAAAFGIDSPKGVLLVGIPGSGKSMVADAVANLYQMPLLRLDIGSIFSAHIGESEMNTRTAIQIASAVSPCLLWIDEIEKGLGGVQSSNYTDGGVTNRVFGTILTWMQEKTDPVFVIATANNVESIPPEFMRAGRFDEIFFLDLPDKDQRIDVLTCLLRRKKRDPEKFDLGKISESAPNYSPAELEKGINNALFVAFADNSREVTTEDIVSEIHKFQPLYNSRREEIEAMRAWALGEGGKGGRARLANEIGKNKPYTTKEIGRQIDLTAEDL